MLLTMTPDVYLRPRKTFMNVVGALLLIAGLFLSSCGRIRDNSPRTSHVWGAGVGDLLCQNFTVYKLEFKDSDNPFDGITASAIDPEGEIYPLEEGTILNCAPDVYFTVRKLISAGKLGVDGRVSDYNK